MTRKPTSFARPVKNKDSRPLYFSALLIPLRRYPPVGSKSHEKTKIIQDRCRRPLPGGGSTEINDHRVDWLLPYVQ